MKKIVGITSAIVTFTYYILYIEKCRDLASQFHFSLFDLQLRLIESIHNEQGQSAHVTRAFNNKASGSVMDGINTYLHFFDIQFLTLFVSPIGLFGIGYFIYTSLQERKKWQLMLLAILLSLPVLEIVNVFESSSVKIVLLLPYMATAIWGITLFFRKGNEHIRLIFIILLALISIIWISVLSEDLGYHCELKEDYAEKMRDIQINEDLQK